MLSYLTGLARFSPSAANLQALKFVFSNKPSSNSSIFRYLYWAAYLKDWAGPAEGERPGAYIVILGDRGITDNFGCDHCIAAQSILLGACEKGLGGCMIGSIDREGLRGELKIPDCYEILLVVALGKPKEKVVLEDLKADCGIKYWRSEDGVHHVPKRLLEDIILD